MSAIEERRRQESGQERSYGPVLETGRSTPLGHLCRRIAVLVGPVVLHDLRRLTGHRHRRIMDRASGLPCGNPDKERNHVP